MSAKLPPSIVPELPAVLPANAQDVHFKTEDDTPVDNMYSEKQQRLFTEPLYSSWSSPGGKRKFLVMANVGLFYAKGKPPVVPDALLSVDVETPHEMWQREHRSYFTWKYGKSPDVVIEIVSNTDGEELGEKLKTYAEAKVPYYVVWDPTHQLGKGRLVGFRLLGETYEPQHDLWFEGIGLGLIPWYGPFEGVEADWLRWCDGHGAVIPTGAEAKHVERQNAEQERHRADEEKQRADQEKLRADQEKLRAERLLAQLRALGVEPD